VLCVIGLALAVVRKSESPISPLLAPYEMIHDKLKRKKIVEGKKKRIEYEGICDLSIIYFFLMKYQASFIKLKALVINRSTDISQ
jgi:hypothetical protein